MAESEEELIEAATRLKTIFGADAFSEANKSLQDAIRQRDAEAISYWRGLIAALPRARL